MSVHAYLATHPYAFALLAFIFGLVVGSFLNVVVHRLPLMLERRWRTQAREVLHPNKAAPRSAKRFDLAYPASHCPHCDRRIRAWENIPIVSFLLLRARCSSCGKSISWRYPLLELLAGTMAAAVAWRYGFGWTAGAGILLTWALLALAFIDYDTQLLPDDITLPLIWIGLLVNTAYLFTPLPAAVIGAVAGYGTFWLVFHAFKLLTGKEGMGFGDFKLLAALGAWLGWQQLPLIVLLSSLLGAIVGIACIIALGRDRRLPIPFGPFLCVAGWIAMMWGEHITRYYFQLMRF
jgi:leader peptidase (prepilin peptidase) / N-methyltransferase